MRRKRAHHSRSYEHLKYYIKFDDSLGDLFLLWFLKTSSARTETRGSCRGALTRWTSNQDSGAATVTQRSS
jgi:hypothetical protein